MSLRLSPLDTLDPFALKLMTSAESRLAAASKEMRVRVESSKKRLTTVRPRSVGSFLTGRSDKRASSSAVSRMSVASAKVTGRRLTASDPSYAGLLAVEGVTGVADDHGVPPVGLVQQHPTVLDVEVGRFLPT